MSINRRFVFVRRKTDTTARPKQFVDAGIQKAGTALAAPGIPMIGLTKDEQEFLMPDILAMPANHADFNAAVRQYFSDYTGFEVAPSKGTRLDASYKDVQYTNLKGETVTLQQPVKVMDYIHYKQALKDPEVAESEAAAYGDARAAYYIYDENIENESKVKLVTTEMDATVALAKLFEQKDKWSTVLTIFGFEPTILSEVEQKLTLSTIARAEGIEPDEKLMYIEKFIKLVTDEDADLKAFLVTLIDNKVIHQEETTYVWDNGTSIITLGNDLNSTLDWLDNPKYSGNVSIMKAQLAKAKTSR